MSDNLIEEVREMGEHPSRADLPMGKTLRNTAEYMEALEVQVQSWTEEARRYAENADCWRTKCDTLEADKAKLREEIIAILNQRIEDILACRAQPLVAKFMAVDEIDWLEETKIAIAAALQETEQ